MPFSHEVRPLAKVGVVIHEPLARALFASQDRARLARLDPGLQWPDASVPLTTAEAIEILRDADVAIGSWKSPAPDEPLLSACPKLRLWVHAAGSVRAM